MELDGTAPARLHSGRPCQPLSLLVPRPLPAPLPPRRSPPAVPDAALLAAYRHAASGALPPSGGHFVVTRSGGAVYGDAHAAGLGPDRRQGCAARGAFERPRAGYGAAPRGAARGARSGPR